jgi:hypothetical protein
MPPVKPPSPLVVQISITPAGEVLALDADGKLWCSYPRDKGVGGIETDDDGRYELRLLPVRLEFRQWRQ